MTVVSANTKNASIPSSKPLESGQTGAPSIATQAFNPEELDEKNADNRLLSLIGFRILLITVLLGATTFFKYRSGVQWQPTQYIIIIGIGLSYLMTIFYLLAVKYNTSYRFQAFMQLLGDVLFWSSLIYIHGGLHSPFTFLYVLSIIFGAILLGRWGAYSVGGLSVFFFIMVIMLEKHEIFHRRLVLEPSFQALWDLAEIHHMFLTFSMLIFSAVLSAYLANILREREKALQMEKLGRRMQRAVNQSIIHGISTGFVFIDMQGTITFINTAAEQMLDIEPVAVRGKALADIFPEVLPYVQKELSGKTWQHYAEIEIQHDDKPSLSYSVAFSPLKRPNGARAGSIVHIRDISEIKQLKQKAFHNEKMAAVGELAAGIAHEIRNPLASISGSIQMLQGELAIDDDMNRLMDIVRKEALRLNTLINDFLSYANPKPPKLKQVDIPYLLEDVHRLIEMDDAYEGIRLEIRKKTRQPYVLGDEGQLRQILWNILKNCADAVKEVARPLIRIELKEGVIDPDWKEETLVLDIEDNGKGMDRTTHEKIFDPFFTTKHSGTGLGMSIVYQVVQAHNGYIEVNSKQGEGARFIIALPIYRNEKQTHDG